MFKYAALGLAAGALMASWAGAVEAADLITYPTSTEKQMPVANASSAINWNGFYAGIYGSSQSSPKGGGQYGGGVDLGVNATFNFVLVGGEIAVQGLGGGAGT